MKKILVLVALLLMCGVAQAEVLDLKLSERLEGITLPKATEGLVYSIKNNTVNNAAGLTILAYKDVNLDALYIGENEPGLAVCYRLGGLERFGWDVPVLKYIDISVGGFAGYQFNDTYQTHADADEGNALDYGLYAKICQIAL